MSFVDPSRPPPAQAGTPSGLDLPLYGATPREAVIRYWRKSAVFAGRASRSEYWWWVLVSVLVSLVLQVVAAALSPDRFADYVSENRALSLQGWLPLLWSAVNLVPGLALGIRRLHDTNRSGWWSLLLLPGLLGSAVQLAVLGLNSDAEAVAANPGPALVALIPALVLSLFGAVCAVIYFAFSVSGPDPRGARFDRPRGRHR